MKISLNELKEWEKTIPDGWYVDNDVEGNENEDKYFDEEGRIRKQYSSNELVDPEAEFGWFLVSEEDSSNTQSVSSSIRKWRKERSFSIITIEVKKEDVDRVKKELNKIKGIKIKVI